MSQLELLIHATKRSTSVESIWTYTLIQQNEDEKQYVIIRGLHKHTLMFLFVVDLLSHNLSLFNR